MSKNGKEYELLIKIAGKVEKSFDSSLKSVEKNVKGFKSTVGAIDKDLSKLEKGFDKVAKVGKKAFDLIFQGATIAAGAVTAATAAAIDIGSEFESAFAGVKKTVDATDEEFEQLREGILDMTRTIPESASAIAGVMEIAGQLGIANDSLLDFTETMINLGVSTNMTAEDAATNLAKLANITNMADYNENGLSNWERLGSTIVDLGNKFATTEEDIVRMSLRMASAAHLAGFSESDILALSTAMSAVGIKAEAGGSAMAKLIKRIQVAVETGSEDLVDYANVANMTTEQFSEAFETNAVGALSAFIGGLNDTERNGKSAIAILDDMSLNEVRLSNMILALAGSETVLNDAIGVANNAWDENIALSEEAEKRYATVESQATLVKNALQELGIQAYDEMRPLIVDALSAIQDALHDLIDSGAIRNLVKNVTGKLPSLKRLFDQNVSTIIDKTKDFGNFIVRNGDKIVGIFGGIAAAIGLLKGVHTVTSGLSFLLDFFGALNPATAVIMGVAAAVGVFAGSIAYLSAEEEKLKNQSLIEHFGDIELGLKDVKEAAEQIAGGEYWQGMREAFEQLQKLDNIAATMDDAQDTLNKLNFKVSLGINLDENDETSYKTAIDQYIRSAQEYVTQQQFAITIAVKAGLDDDQLNSTGVLGVLNTFYANKQSELADIGGKLRDAVNNAFTDGFLDIDEAKEIQALQGQLARIQEEITRTKNAAKLDLLGEDFASTDLSVDSFKNIRSEAFNLIKENAAASKEVLAQEVADVTAAYDQMIDAAVGPARIRQLESQKQAALDAITSSNTQNNAQDIMGLFKFDISAITGAYNNEVTPTLENITENTQQRFRNMFDVEAALQGETIPWGQIVTQMYSDMQTELEGVLNRGDKAAVKDLLKEMEPDAAQAEALIQQYRETGQQIPEALMEGMLSYSTLKVMAGEGGESDIWTIVGNAVANDEQLSALMGTLEEKGATVPEGINQAIIDNASKVEEGVGELYDKTTSAVQSQYSNAINAECTVNIKYKLNETTEGGEGPKLPSGATIIPDNNARGGIINFKTLSWLAEEGPEAVIPLDRSDNAISLWEQAGKLLGIGEDNTVTTAKTGLEMVDGSGNMEITYSPQFIFNGDAPSKEDMIDAAHISQKEFDQMMQEWQKKNRRTKFAS